MSLPLKELLIHLRKSPTNRQKKKPPYGSFFFCLTGEG